MCFPLFRLPYLAIVEVFKNMSHETLFLLSISTRNMKNSIRTYLPKKFITADIVFCQTVKIIPNNGPGHFRVYGLMACDGVWPKKAIRCTVGNDLAAVNLVLGQVDFYWSQYDFEKVVSNFISHVYVCWNCPKICVTYDGNYNLEHFSVLMETLKHNNLKIESMRFLKNQYYGENLVKYLHKCADITSKLSIDSGIDDFFRTRHSRDFIRVKELEIRNCRWAFLEDFVECKSIKMECVSIGHNFGVYINNFIQKWMNDYECQLESVTITNCPFEFKEITKELYGKKTSRGVLKLQRNDGKRILVTLNERVLKIELI